MKQRALLAAAAIAVATSVMADSPHFVRATGTLNNDGEYVATWKEAGLGTNQLVSYTLSASSPTQFTYQCYTKSNNQPQGAPNYVFPSILSTSGTFSSGKNGTVSGSLTLTPEPTNDCTGNGLKLCLVAVDYRNVTLTDTSNNVSVSLPNRSDTYINSATGAPTNCEPF